MVLRKLSMKFLVRRWSARGEASGEVAAWGMVPPSLQWLSGMIEMGLLLWAPSSLSSSLNSRRLVAEE
jgi:hypothetical protein